MNILLVGHRGTGKTTTANLLTQHYGVETLDLDRHIEEAEQRTCAQIIAESEPRFRQLERTHLTALLQQDSDDLRLITLGAGCAFIPTGTPTIWLTRAGWEESARKERARLRPELSFAQEVDWMRRTREPLWASRATLRVDIEPTQSPKQIARDVFLLLSWLQNARHTLHTKKTFFVPQNDEELSRARQDASWLGAGMEIRSDFFPQIPDTNEPNTLLSLRHEDPSWLLQNPNDLNTFDIDIHCASPQRLAHTLEGVSPRQVLLSFHAKTHETEHLHTLLAYKKTFLEKLPAWAPFVVLKYAPYIQTWEMLQQTFRDVDTHLIEPEHKVTFLPQTRTWAWLRPILLQRYNQTNYLPVGLAGHRYGEDADIPTPYDLQDWLPHLQTPHPTEFDALIGDPVDGSIGDVWHRTYALRHEEPERGYLKIPIASSLGEDAFKNALSCLHALGIRGLSVTSPHKRRICTEQDDVQNPLHLDAMNTLRRTRTGWTGIDTDADGMLATLRHLEERGIGPGTIALIGRGGVSPAVLSAIEQSPWQLLHHASARQGWASNLASVDVVINASGDHDGAYHDPPACTAWVDLHYRNVRLQPETIFHLHGAIFFRAQALAQRSFWNQENECEETPSEMS